MTYPHVSKEFEIAVFALVQRLLSADGMRFFIYVPWAQLFQDIGSVSDLDVMIREYQKKYWEMDPMHCSRFEDSDTVVVSNSMLMDDAAWRETTILREFYAPNGYFHNCDMFIKQKDRIVAVLSLVRKHADEPFTAEELDLLNNIQPFIEYSFGKIYIPDRVHNRSSLSREYGLTPREMDVVEIALTGANNKMVSKHLNISLPTLRTHMQSIFAKVGVHSNAELLSTLMRLLK